jgi:hypothetical protein
MASNDDGKRKLEEEAESSTTRKRLRPSHDDGGDDNSSDCFDSPEEETKMEEEVSSDETSMNKLDTFKEKLFARRACGMLFGDDGDTPSTSLEPRTPESHRCSDEESSDDNDDFWM